MPSYADIIVNKSQDSGGGGVLRLSYHPMPFRTANWKAVTVLCRDKKKVQIPAWGDDPEDAIYNLCLDITAVKTTEK